MKYFLKAIFPALGILITGMLGITFANHLDGGYGNSSQIAHKITFAVFSFSILLVCFGLFLILLLIKDALFDLKQSTIPSKVKPKYIVLSWEDNKDQMQQIYSMCEQGLEYKIIETDLNKDAYTLQVKDWNLMVQHINRRNTEIQDD